MRVRIAKSINALEFGYGESFEISGVKIEFRPAGHVLGSAQVRLEYGGEVWVVTGDYKLDRDEVAVPYEPVECDVFISEATFALPIFNWPSESEVLADISHWWGENTALGKLSVINCYSLGKAQRLLAGLPTLHGRIFADASTERMNAVHRSAGVALPETYELTAVHAQDLAGALLLSPRFDFANLPVPAAGMSFAAASGWMQVRKFVRSRVGVRGFVLSDHPDWQGLIAAIVGTKAKRVYLTHGFSQQLARYLREQKGLSAYDLEDLREED
jgi:putative mRNA 3-end processing factor